MLTCDIQQDSDSDNFCEELASIPPTVSEDAVNHEIGNLEKSIALKAETLQILRENNLLPESVPNVEDQNNVPLSICDDNLTPLGTSDDSTPLGTGDNSTSMNIEPLGSHETVSDNDEKQEEEQKEDISHSSSPAPAQQTVQPTSSNQTPLGTDDLADGKLTEEQDTKQELKNDEKNLNEDPPSVKSPVPRLDKKISIPLTQLDDILAPLGTEETKTKTKTKTDNKQEHSSSDSGVGTSLEDGPKSSDQKNNRYNLRNRKKCKKIPKNLKEPDPIGDRLTDASDLPSEYHSDHSTEYESPAENVIDTKVGQLGIVHFGLVKKPKVTKTIKCPVCKEQEAQEFDST